MGFDDFSFKDEMNVTVKRRHKDGFRDIKEAHVRIERSNGAASSRSKTCIAVHTFRGKKNASQTCKALLRSVQERCLETERRWINRVDETDANSNTSLPWARKTRKCIQYNLSDEKTSIDVDRRRPTGIKREGWWCERTRVTWSTRPYPTGSRVCLI